MIQQTINLNVIPNDKPIVIPISQYDTGDGRLQFKLDMELSGDAKLQGTKSNGEHFEISGTLSGKVFTCDVTELLTDTDGKAYANIVIDDGTDRIGTQAFILHVQKDAKGVIE